MAVRHCVAGDWEVVKNVSTKEDTEVVREVAS